MAFTVRHCCLCAPRESVALWPGELWAALYYTKAIARNRYRYIALVTKSRARNREQKTPPHPDSVTLTPYTTHVGYPASPPLCQNVAQLHPESKWIQPILAGGVVQHENVSRLSSPLFRTTKYINTYAFQLLDRPRRVQKGLDDCRLVIRWI
jgi:hypothetical protein